MTRLLAVLMMTVFAAALSAEEGTDVAATETSESPWYEDIDWDPFDMKGITPRYAYLDFDNFIGYAHYVGFSYFQKSGAESEGVTLRTGLGTMGKKYNLSYSNSFSFMHVDFGLSYYDLADDNYRQLNYEELLGIELGLRMWVVQIIGVHTENTSFITLAYGF